MVDSNDMPEIITNCGKQAGMTDAEIQTIIQKLNPDGYRTKSGLQDMANDNEWGDYGIPKGLKKKIEAVLSGGGDGGSGASGGGFTSNIANNSGTVNNVSGNNMTFNQQTTNNNAGGGGSGGAGSNKW